MEIWDNTKLSAYICEMKGHYAMERHLVPKEPAEALAFGIAMHAAREVWIKESLMQGVPVPDGQTGEAIPYCSNIIGLAKQAFLTAWEKELPLDMREVLEFNGDRRSYANFCRLFEAYVNKFPLAMYDKIIAVETPFTLFLGKTPKGVEIAWSGILDLAIEWQGGLFYDDLKTSSYGIDDKFFNQFRLSGQLTGYAWAGKELGLGNFNGIMVHGIEVKVPQEGVKLKKDGTPYARQGRSSDAMIGVDIIPISDEAIAEWKKDTLRKIDKIHEARELKHWVRDRGDICNNFNGCQFRPVCSVGEDLRESRIEEYYKVKEWKPLERK